MKQQRGRGIQAILLGIRVVLLVSFVCYSSVVFALKGVNVFYETEGDSRRFQIVHYDIDAQKFLGFWRIEGAGHKVLREQLYSATKDLGLTVYVNGIVRLN